jgi:hypothetical protein
MAGTTEERCWLCARSMGTRMEYHHPVPKSRGGRETVPVHPICHRTLHRTFTNTELEQLGCDIAAIRARPAIAKFLEWVAGKEPDFHAPTRGKLVPRAHRH